MTTSFKAKKFRADLLFNVNRLVWENLPMKIRRSEHNREVVRKHLECMIDSLDYD